MQSSVVQAHGRSKFQRKADQVRKVGHKRNVERNIEREVVRIFERTVERIVERNVGQRNVGQVERSVSRMPNLLCIARPCHYTLQ
jgi:hypothetical protein